ncbi:MAG: GIY-YIG nuclease family protein [Candidatus Pacebacteria bacterium]|nr:GIY-YIG nuclease family protein [Candidatus Paceibacterota bacterium]
MNTHNTRKVKSTKNACPWKVIFTEEHQNQKDAICREKQIKKWKSRKAIERLIHGPIV